MGFEKFEKKGTPPGSSHDTPSIISVRKSGAIGINRVAMDEYFEGYDWVNFYYNKETNQIGIKPRENENANTYRITRRGGSGTVKARRFLSEYALVPDQTTRYEAQWHPEEELVYINLDNPIETVN